MDRIDAMTAFVTVAELRGFAPAARRLRLSPSAVTRLVAGLEERLGSRLLQRTTRSVTLSDAGARYLERARRIVDEVREAEAAVRAERSAPSGRLVVSAPAVFGRIQVAPVMCAFLSRYPAVTGELTLSDRTVNLVEDGVDAAVRIGMLADSSLIARRVGATRIVVVGAPKYLTRKRVPRSPADLAGHDLVHLTAIGPMPVWRFVRDGRESQIALVPRLVTNSADAAIRYAELGGGLTLALSYQVADAVRAKRLQIVLRDHEPAPLPIHVVHPTTRLLSANVRAFIDLVVETCSWQFVGVDGGAR